jgi:hypothetical protein
MGDEYEADLALAHHPWVTTTNAAGSWAAFVTLYPVSALGLDLDQFDDPRDFPSRNHEMRPLGTDAEPCASSDIIVLRPTGRRVVHPHVQQVHTRLVLGVESADIGQRAAGLHYHGDPVQLVVPRVKDVSAQTAAPKCLSNALTSSPAITWGLRPSIWCRWTKCTTSPSRSSATDGLLG